MEETYTAPEAVAPDEALEPLDDGLTPADAAALRELQGIGDVDDLEEPTGDRLDAEPEFSGLGLITVPQATGTLADIRARVMAWANTKVGQKETPPFSNIIFAWADVKPAWQGQPWCAAFVTDAWSRAGVDLRRMIANPYYCPYLESLAKRHNAWRAYGSSFSPKAGDLILFGRRLATHVGLSAPAPGNYSGYRTIEGNTSPSNAGSQTNGDGCYVRLRSGSFIRGWIDMDVLVPAMVKAGALTIEKPKTVKAAATRPVESIPGEPWRGLGRPISFASYKRGLADPKGGGNVRLVQLMLARQGAKYMPKPADGKDSKEHREGVKAWQLAIGDTGSDADGVLGVRQFARLVKWAGWRPVA